MSKNNQENNDFLNSLDGVNKTKNNKIKKKKKFSKKWIIIVMILIVIWLGYAFYLLSRKESGFYRTPFFVYYVVDAGLYFNSIHRVG